jgi:two-component system, OmpR family, KDP operon response regulator KdpE
VKPPRLRSRPPYRGDVASIFVVEDDQRIRAALVGALADRGHAVHASAKGLDALAEIVNDPPDAVVLDLGLPDVDGAELLKMLRAVSTVPVVVATARDDEREIVRLLDAGADDYVVKPFSADQIEARLRAVLRRAADRGAGGAGEPIVVGGLRIDPVRREVSLDGSPLDLTRKEFDLLAHLARANGAVVTKRELLGEVWRQPYGGADKTVDVHLSWLRRKLGETASEPRYVHTVRGVGVKLVAPTE